MAALCDVYEPYLMRDRSAVDPRWLANGKVPEMGEPFGPASTATQDFRRVLDRKDIDAVCIATPDHWHAIQTILAMQAGKDVYVEKPLTITVVEGRRMVEAQARTGRVVQVGLNRRGSPVYQKLAPLVRSGLHRQGHHGAGLPRRATCTRTGSAGCGRRTRPKGFDWDAWLGPRAFRPYQYNIAPYYFRWWKDYSSQMGNWGVHYMDVIRWLMGEQAPAAISAHGGRYAVDDDRTIPDTMEVDLRVPLRGDRHLRHLRGHAAATALPAGEIELRGTKGDALRGRGRLPDRAVEARPVPDLEDAGRGRGVEAGRRLAGRRRQVGLGGALVRNFLDCVKSRQHAFVPARGGPPLDLLRPPRQHRARDTVAARVGRKGRALHQPRARQRPAPLRVPQALDLAEY